MTWVSGLNMMIYDLSIDDDFFAATEIQLIEFSEKAKIDLKQPLYSNFLQNALGNLVIKLHLIQAEMLQQYITS